MDLLPIFLGLKIRNCWFFFLLFFCELERPVCRDEAIQAVSLFLRGEQPGCDLPGMLPDWVKGRCSISLTCRLTQAVLHYTY